jgi:hypothetical protein
VGGENSSPRSHSIKEWLHNSGHNHSIVSGELRQRICCLVGRGFSRAKIGATSFGLSAPEGRFLTNDILPRFWLESGILPLFFFLSFPQEHFS